MLCDSSGGFGCVLARMKDITLCALSSRYCHLGMEVSSMQSVRRRNQKNTMNVREDYDFRKKYLFSVMCMFLGVCGVCEFRCPQRPEKGVQYPGTGVTGHC